MAGLVLSVGVLGLVASWRAGADELDWRDQLRWIAVGASFLMLAVAAVTAWIMVGARRVRAGVQDLLVRRREVLAGASPAVEISMRAVLAASEQLVTAPGMARVHRAHCLLVHGKPTTVVPSTEAANRPRCGVCGS